MRICPICKQPKTFAEFYHRVGLPYGYCKECAKIKAGQRYERDKQTAVRRAVTWAGRNPERARLNWRRSHLKHLYGLSLEYFNEISLQQNRQCAICGGYPSGRKRNLSVDHDHKTQKIRGLLCERCNLLLGKVEKIPGWIASAHRYINRAKCLPR